MNERETSDAIKFLTFIAIVFIVIWVIWVCKNDIILPGDLRDTEPHPYTPTSLTRPINYAYVGRVFH